MRRVQVQGTNGYGLLASVYEVTGPANERTGLDYGDRLWDREAWGEKRGVRVKRAEEECERTKIRVPEAA